MRSLRWVGGPFFIGAGALHFIIPDTYKRIVPPYLPAPEALVYLSGRCSRRATIQPGS